MNVELFTEPTPNPNALKFILDGPVKNQGQSNFHTIEECRELPLAEALFKIRGVDHIYFFQNVITVTKFSYEDWEVMESKVATIIEEFLPGHDPDYLDKNPEEERRKKLSPELKDIEAILDRTIRPGLQADGGDLQCVDYREKVLIISYQGACGSCPSSQYGTLQTIENILRAEYEQDIRVITPEMSSSF